MGPLLAMINMLLATAYLAQKLWGPAALHSATILNIGPVISTTRPSLRLQSPFEAMFGHRPDIRWLGGVFGADAHIKRAGSKPGSLEPQASACILLGAAVRTIGWRFLRLADMAIVTSYHAIVDNASLASTPHRRPALLAEHDALASDSPLSPGPAIFSCAVRDCFATRPADAPLSDGSLVISPVTRLPTKYIIAASDDTSEITILAYDPVTDAAMPAVM